MQIKNDTQRPRYAFDDGSIINYLAGQHDIEQIGEFVAKQSTTGTVDGVAHSSSPARIVKYVTITRAPILVSVMIRRAGRGEFTDVLGSV